MIQISYSTVEAVAARLHGIADSKRGAFRARLRHFLRLEFPPGANTGKGKRASYGVVGLFQLLMALELSQAGLAPARAVTIITGNWARIELGLLQALTPLSALDHWTPPLLDPYFAMLVLPEALRDLTLAGDEVEYLREEVEIVHVSELPSKFMDEDDDGDDYPVVGENHRTLVLLLRPIAQLAVGALLLEQPNLEPYDVWSEMQRIVGETSAALDAGSHKIGAARGDD